jgi:hypothetical protein
MIFLKRRNPLPEYWTRIAAAVLMGLMLLWMSGCGLLPTSMKDRIAEGVKQYCSRLTPGERQVMRSEVNAIVAPNSIKVTCEGDPPEQ